MNVWQRPATGFLRALAAGLVGSVLAAPVTLTIPTDQEAEQRWLVRMSMTRKRVVVGRVDGRPQSVRLWATTSQAEFLVVYRRWIFLVDTRQGRVFQMADFVHDQLDREFDLLFSYPVPLRDVPSQEPSATVELRDPGVTTGPVLLAEDNPMTEALRSRVGGVTVMPESIRVEGYREAFVIAFRAGEMELEVYLDQRPESRT